jgi:hypothetical protein
MLWVSLEGRSRTNSPHQRFHSKLFCKVVKYFCWTLYKAQKDAHVTEFILSDNCFTCFGRQCHPSSGAQNNCNYSIWNEKPTSHYFNFIHISTDLYIFRAYRSILRRIHTAIYTNIGSVAVLFGPRALYGARGPNSTATEPMFVWTAGSKHVEIRRYMNKIEIVKSVGFSFHKLKRCKVIYNICSCRFETWQGKNQKALLSIRKCE